MEKKKLYIFLICDKETGETKGYLFSCYYEMLNVFKSTKFFLHLQDVSFVPSDSCFFTTKIDTLYKLNICRKTPEA